MRQKAIAKLKSTAGVSFAEMLACTVLFSLAYMVATSGLLFAYNSTGQVMKEADAQTVSDAILNRIGGEIAGTASQDSVKMNANADATIVSFTGASGIPIYICAKSVRDGTPEGGENPNELLIYYRQTTTNDEDANATVIPESNWTFDKVTYQGYTITNLTFTKGSHHGNLTVTTSLTLESPSGKSFSTKRTVCCYNRENADVEIISVKDILDPPGDDPSNQKKQASDFAQAVEEWIKTGKSLKQGDGKSTFYQEYYDTHTAVQMPDEYRDKLIEAGLLGKKWNKTTLYWWSYPVTNNNGDLQYIVTFANGYADPKAWWTDTGRQSIQAGFVVVLDGVTYLRTNNDVSPGAANNAYSDKQTLIDKMEELGYIVYNGDTIPGEE